MRALLSVADKTGIVDLARVLHQLGWDILSTGGTAQVLRRAGIPVQDVSDITGVPPVLNGRVKTLHPAIHAGILARPTPEDDAELATHGWQLIDLVVVNLYPFATIATRPHAQEDELIEEIDVGGVALLRAAAKNMARVGVICDPADYPVVAEELQRDGGLSADTRRRLAAKAFAHTAAYDATISRVLHTRLGEDYPPILTLAFEKVRTLRYGENPHQSAALYRSYPTEVAGLTHARVLQGKELSFNNIMDLEAALSLAGEFIRPTVVIIKHTNPCGVASADTLAEAYAAALACDPLSAFGGVVAANRPVDPDTAHALSKQFVEAIVAPGYEPAALDRLAKKRDCRVLELALPIPIAGHDLRRLRGGILVQSWDALDDDPATWKTVTRRGATPDELVSLAFAWTVAKHVKSNAIVLARGESTVGIGAGQMSRVDAARLAVEKAGERARGAVLASDAFFPFRDGVDVACQAGVTALVQPGGSVRDGDIIAAADEYGVAMLLTGRRHFRH
jgi:phosphoribosylaminoimidazolecarboxamide formyltransferase/IMP cyclohydrolase